jgi:hypothetical protein
MQNNLIAKVGWFQKYVSYAMRFASGLRRVTEMPLIIKLKNNIIFVNKREAFLWAKMSYVTLVLSTLCT